MNSISPVLVLVVVLIVAVVAWILYLLRFRLKKIIIKGGIVEAELERNHEQHPTNNVISQNRTDARIEATNGGVIEESTIKAPTGSGARLKQAADGKGSKITDSHIELK